MTDTLVASLSEGHNRAHVNGTHCHGPCSAP